MHRKTWLAVGTLLLATQVVVPVQGIAEDVSKLAIKAVEKCTLDQPETRPFHLKATYAPSRERDNDSNRVGEVEFWWQSPNKWRREVRSPEFHQIAITDGSHQWQKNDGDYFPDWLRELSEAIVRPVPIPTDALITRIKTAQVRHLMGQTNIDWDSDSTSGDALIRGKGYVALSDKTGLLNYAGGPGFGGEYHDFKDFHGRMIAYTIASGYIEVTAKVSVLEDLKSIPDGFFDAGAQGGDAQPIHTIVLDETELRKNLLPGDSFTWPALTDGPLEGVVWTEVVLDRTGRIREMIPPVADNPGVAEAAEKGFRAMQFRPILRDGIPVQATGRLSVRFKAVRPAGMETFDSARSYFDRGRKVSCLGAGASAPYLLRAEFQTATKDGIQTGRYEDTWISGSEWKREAWFGSSHLVRAQAGEKYYVLSEGPETGLLRLVLTIVEPIPASDTMTESDWRIRRDMVGGAKTVRVLRGPEGANGELEAGKSNGYWFDDGGHLVKSYTMGFDIRPLDTKVYDGVEMARRIDVLKDGKVGLRLTVKEVGPADATLAKTFALKGHEWQRAFTAEVR